MSGDQQRAVKMQCAHGHPYTPENTLRNGFGWRYCRECNRSAAREYQRRKARARA